MVSKIQTVKTEVITYKTIYQAIDGTEFDNKEQCQQYERLLNSNLITKEV